MFCFYQRPILVLSKQNNYCSSGFIHLIITGITLWGHPLLCDMLTCSQTLHPLQSRTSQKQKPKSARTLGAGSRCHLLGSPDGPRAQQRRHPAFPRPTSCRSSEWHLVFNSQTASSYFPTSDSLSCLLLNFSFLIYYLCESP